MDGTSEGWSRFLLEVEPRLRAYVESSLGERARRWTDASDIVQRSVEEVWRSLRASDEPFDEEEVRKRLYRTAQSRIRDSVRNHDRLAGESALGAGGLDPPVDESPGPVTIADQKSWLAGIVGRLPEKQAQVVRCCGLEGLSYVEAGKRLGLEPDTVRKRYQAARETLARWLAGHLDD